jgi:hypothetical protein
LAKDGGVELCASSDEILKKSHMPGDDLDLVHLVTLPSGILAGVNRELSRGERRRLEEVLKKEGWQFEEGDPDLALVAPAVLKHRFCTVEYGEL